MIGPFLIYQLDTSIRFASIIVQQLPGNLSIARKNSQISELRMHAPPPFPKT